MSTLIVTATPFLRRVLSRGSSSLLLVGILSAYAPAQVVTFASPSSVLGFGTEALIVSDMDGGGRRDVVVSRIDASTGTSEIFLMSSETTVAIAHLPINALPPPPPRTRRGHRLRQDLHPVAVLDPRHDRGRRTLLPAAWSAPLPPWSTKRSSPAVRRVLRSGASAADRL